MRRITATEFRQQTWKEVKTLPFVVTLRGADWIIVREVGDDERIGMERSDLERDELEKMRKEEAEGIKRYYPGALRCPRHHRIRAMSDHHFPCGCAVIKEVKWQV